MTDLRDLTDRVLVFLIEHERLHGDHGDLLFLARAEEELNRRKALGLFTEEHKDVVVRAALAKAIAKINRTNRAATFH